MVEHFLFVEHVGDLHVNYTSVTCFFAQLLWILVKVMEIILHKTQFCVINIFETCKVFKKDNLLKYVYNSCRIKSVSHYLFNLLNHGSFNNVMAFRPMFWLPCDTCPIRRHVCSPVLVSGRRKEAFSNQCPNSRQLTRWFRYVKGSRNYFMR